MSTQDRKRISPEAMEARRPLSPGVLVDGDSEHAHQDPGPVRAARTARGKRRDEARIPTMARFMLNSAKDDHLPSMARLLVDLSADKEARELASEWLRLDPCDDSCGKKCIAADNRERLFAWVRAKVASIVSERAWAKGRRDSHILARVYLSLWPQTPKADGLSNARALLDAAKAWPS